MSPGSSPPPPSDATSSTVTPPPDGRPVELEAVRAALEADYEILGELGRGGMAVVYRAREKELDREVAIKVLPAQMSFDAEFVERFQREARTAGKLEHPHIVPIYRVGRSAHLIYFVMKLLTGQSLATLLKARTKLPVPEVRRILMDVSSALGYAAKRGVVHRDIKPDNILLDSEGRCVVTDFGIAKTRTGPHTAPGTSMGTPRYMSPEHAQGNKVDGRSDIYSLGVVGYQALTGATPFDADDPFAVLYKHINEPIPRPALETEDEWALYATIEKMLAKKPEDRFQTADELIAALGGEVHTVTLVHSRDSLQQQAFGPTEIIPTPMPWQRRLVSVPRNVWAGLGAVAAVVLFGWVALLAWGPTEGAVPDTSAAPSAGATTLAGAPGAAGATTAAGNPVAANRGTTTGVAGAAMASVGTKTPPAATSAAPVAEAPKPPAMDRFTRCPAPGGATARRLGVPALLLDSVAPLRLGARRLTFTYHVCGLEALTPFVTNVRIERRDVGFRGTKVDLPFRFPELARNAGMRTRRNIEDLSKAPAGRYTLTVSIEDNRGRLRQVERDFFIVRSDER